MMKSARASLYGRLLVTLIVALFATLIAVGGAGATNGKVLILDSTVSGGAASAEATAAGLVGRGVDVVNGATWGAMTTAQFADYDALVMGDPTCVGDTSPIAAAEANRAVWSPAVTGNVVLIGTDPVYHLGQGGGQLTNSGMAFAVDEPGATGLYMTLSCYYYSAGLNTPVPVLDQLSSFGGFEVRGQFNFGTGCPAASHIVASHPALAGLTDADLSNWGCSTHEAFDAFPADFAVLAINFDIGGGYVASDGTVGGPYILARGKSLTVISNISLAPATATNPVGTSHTVTATVTENSSPVAGTMVTFTVIAGPHTGVTGTGLTDPAGTASFSYTGTTVGTDLIHATYVTSTGLTQTSNVVSKEWTDAPSGDTEAPGASCVETANPSGNNIPKAGPGAGKSGQNPDGFYQLIGTDNVAVASIVVRDSGSSFVSNPFASGDKVKVTQAPGVTPSDTRPGAGVIVSHLKLKGDAILRVTDTSGNVTEVTCRVAPLPKSLSRLEGPGA